MSSKEEYEMVKALHQKELFDQIMPALRQLVKNGGDAQAILKKSEPLAAIALVTASASGDVKASTEILNRVSGKPIERSVNIYGDIAKLNEKDVDQQIMLLLQKTGAKKFLKDTLQIPSPKKAQKRKPRKSTLIIDGQLITDRPSEGTHTSAEARPTPEPQDEGAD